MMRIIKTILVLVALMSCTKAFSQSPEELIINIYAEELETIAKNRLEYQNDKASGFSEDLTPIYANIANHGVLMQEYLGARSVAAMKSEYGKFLLTHILPAEEELDLFNKYVKAYLEEYSSKTEAETPRVSSPYFPKYKKSLKIQAETKDPVTGGDLWTFSNGIRVLHKQAPMNDHFLFNLVIRGGYAEVRDLKEGEGPYVGDMLMLYNVAGMKWYDFKRALAVRGIQMDCKVTISELQVCGSAPVGEKETVLSALAALANDRSMDAESFDHYRETMHRQGKNYAPFAVADSIMRPGYKYTPYKYMASLAMDFPQRVDSYFEEQFSRVNDGMLIVIGDISSYDAQKTFSRYANAFKSGSRYAVRSHVEYSQRAGVSTNTINAQDQADGSVNIAVSSQMTITSESFMALKLARIELENRLKEAFQGRGMTFKVSEEVEYYPYERMTMLVSCKNYDSSTMMALELRSAFIKLISQSVTDDALKIDKALLLNELNEWMSSPQGNIDAAIIRYSGGKDHLADFKTKVDKVKASQVKDILSALVDASRAEFIIQ